MRTMTLSQIIGAALMLLATAGAVLLMTFTLSQFSDRSGIPAAQAASATPAASPSETLLPRTPLATLTPSNTLRPPPTFEPPTLIPSITATPTITPTPTLDFSISIPGLYGLETPTPATTAGCEPREDWTLTYSVQRDDAIASIAQRYGTYTKELVAGNCLANPDLIVIGQELRVPGAAHPITPEYVCSGYEVLTPINGAVTVAGGGLVTFNWRGPRTPLNLIRIYRADGSYYEKLVELRQNQEINVGEHLPNAGTYTWYIYPLDRDFKQIDCQEGGPFTFTKEQVPTATPTIASQQP